MSIKIYSGYRLQLDGKPLTIFANEVRALIQPLMRNTFATMKCEEAINIYHRRQLIERGLLPAEKVPDTHGGRIGSPWSIAALDEKDDDYIKDMTSFSLMLYTDPQDVEAKWTYLTIYGPRTLQAYFTHEFSKTHGLEEYGYWNNTDAPEDVSEEEWQERYDTWNRIGILDSAPIECGLSVEMLVEGWHYMEAMLAVHSREDSVVQDQFERVINKDGLLDKCAQRLAVDIDVYQQFKDEPVKNASELIEAVTDDSRGEEREKIKQKVLKIITLPSWKDLTRSPMVEQTISKLKKVNAPSE